MKIVVKDKQNKKIKYLEFEKWYLNQLDVLTDLVYNVGALPIFITLIISLIDPAPP